MAIWGQQVYSSMIEHVRYDDETQQFMVTFNTGSVWTYDGVPEDVAKSVANAASVGQAFNEKIKYTYKGRKGG